MKTESKRAWIAVILIGVSFLALAIMLFPTFQVGAYQDDALYINLAHALAESQGYVDLMRVGDPPHTFVPPVYPLMLASLLMVFPYAWLEAADFWPLQFMSAMLVLGGLGCFAVVLRQRKIDEWLLVLALTALAPITVGMAWHIMTEASYFFFSIAALAALTIWENRSRPLAWIVVALTLAALASTTRLIGLSLLGAISFFLWRRLSPFRWLAANVVLFGPIAIWFARNVILGSAVTGEYAAGLTPTSANGFVSALAENLMSILTATLPNVLLPGLNGPQTLAATTHWGIGFVPAILGVVFTGIAIVGLICAVRRRQAVWAIELYFVLYFGLLLATQFALDGGERYLAPVFPFLVLYFWEGAKWLLQGISRLRHPTFVSSTMTVSAIVLLSLYAGRGVQAVVQPVRNRLPDVTLGTIWLRGNTPVDAIIMANGPREVYLYAQRKIVPFPASAADHAVMAQRITCSQADYVLVRPRMAPGAPQWDEATAQFIAPALDADRTDFALVYASPDELTRVYQIVGSETADCDAAP